VNLLAYVAHTDLCWFVRLQAWTPPAGSGGDDRPERAW